MLQIMGWLLCAALFCFGVSMIGNANYQVEDASGKKRMSEAGNLAAVVAIIAAFGFAFWFYVQGRSLDDPSPYSYSSSYGSTAAPGDDIEAAAAEAMAAAEAAAAEASGY